jgi:alanine dehydrogenase
MIRLASRKLYARPGFSTATRSLQGLTVGVPKESLDGECRVALTPVYAGKLVKAGAKVKIEKNAGALSGFTDEMFKQSGAEIVESGEAWKAQVVAKVRYSFY